MYESILVIIYIIPLIAILNLLTKQRHFLIVLLSLEGITLSLTLLVPLIIINIYAPNPASAVIILRFGACEARLGLRLIVAISRIYGNDIIKSLTITKC